MQNTDHITANDFIPINMNTIRVGIKPKFCFFLKNLLDNEVGYVLYNKGEHAIQQYHLEELQNNKVQNLYIRKNDQGKYYEYIESSLKLVMANEGIDVKEKTSLMYNVAKNIMLDVFNDPRCGTNIERSKNWVANAVGLLMTNKEASSNMLNMVSYDYYTYTHSVNVSVLGLLFAKYIGINNDSMNLLGTGLMLHDIGKTQIDSSLVKRKGRLNNDEFEEMKKHVEKGASILKQIGGLDNESLYAVSQHHEREDGGGYPDGLHGNNIHGFGKIAKIVDVYDALTTNRPYSEARKPLYALTVMGREMKGSFSLRHLKYFIRFLGSSGG